MSPQDTEIEEAPTGMELTHQYALAQDITDQLTDDVITKLGMTCVRGYDIDKASIAGWLSELEEIRNMARQSTEETKTYPWPGASDVKYPLITQARSLRPLSQARPSAECSSAAPDLA